MKADCLFAGFNLNRIIQQQGQKKAHFMNDALQTRGNIYLNVEAWLMFAHPYQNFSLCAWV